MSGDAPTPASAPVVVNDDNARKWLAVAVIAQFVLVVGYVVWHAQTSAASNVEMLVVGAENTFVTMVLSFYFGSSSGSVQKGQILDKVRQ